MGWLSDFSGIDERSGASWNGWAIVLLILGLLIVVPLALWFFGLSVWELFGTIADD